eukprot:scaffold45702_cov64-Phaeocystis_antarctica.AAC.4
MLRADRASGRWPRGRPWLLCASPLSRCTAGPQPEPHRTCRPSARRTGHACLQPHDDSADSPHHPHTPFGAPSAPCEIFRAGPKRKGSPGSRGRTSTLSAAFA